MRRHLNPSLVISCIALFVALGGVSWAAVKLPRNSVGTAQIKSDAVTGSKVKAGSLSATDFAAGELPRGPQGERGLQGATGPQGAQGAAGAAGISGYEVIRKTTGHIGAASTSIECPSGKKVFGGGAFTAGATSSVTASFPVQDVAWEATATSTPPNSYEFTVIAICGNATE